MRFLVALLFALLAAVPAPAGGGSRPLAHFIKKYARADMKGRTSLETQWRGSQVDTQGEILLGGLYNRTRRERMVVVAPEKDDWLVVLRGLEGTFAYNVLEDAAAGRRIVVTGRLDSADYARKQVHLEPSMAKIIGTTKGDLAFLDGLFGELERGKRKPRGFESQLLSFLSGQSAKEIVDFLCRTAKRDYPFERDGVPRIKETSCGMLGRMGRPAAEALVEIIEAYRTRIGFYNRRVLGYAVVCLGDAGDKRAWKYEKMLDRRSGIELACVFMLFERSRDLLPEKRWMEFLTLADTVLRMDQDSTTRRHAQEALDAYTSETWGASPRHKKRGAPSGD